MLKGALAGLIASFPGFFAILVYVCVWSAVATDGEIAAILLASVTVIPLMMILTVFLPNLVLGVLTGLALGLIGKFRGAVPAVPVALLLGVVASHLIFRDLFPWFFSHKAGDNDMTVLLTPLPFVAVYGASLGWLVWKLFRKMASGGV